MHNLYDLIGIGIGPFNMSLAALLEKTSGQKSLFLEKTPHFVWHPGMLMKNSKLQVHYLKDLVTLADPTNPYSFLMFLSEHKRLYKFLNQKTSVISRLEFNHYLQWVSKKLSNLKFGIDVSSVSFEKDSFFIKTNCGVYQSHHLVLGTGRAPHIPDCLKFLKSETLFHSSEYLQKTKPLKGKSVAIIGGGQSGAEILHDILNKENDLPAEILIASKRLNFQPMDDSCFTNEFFTPSYAKLFYHLDEKTRHELLKQQLLASDGISQDLADEIYRRIYELKYILNSPISINFFFNHRLTHARPYHEKYRLQFQNRNDGKSQYFDADHVILCTGYRYKIPKFLEPILNKIEFNEKDYIVNEDYSIKWQHEKTNKIFVQNCARNTHGIADPNLSLAAWRSAKIINSLFQKHHYEDMPDESWITTQNSLDEQQEEMLPNFSLSQTWATL